MPGRSIRVRGWDPDLKQMLPVVDLSAPASEHKWLGAKDVVILQSIGLEDKNGVEVFEGHIVKFTAIFGFHSELMHEWKEMHKLDSLNSVPDLFEAILVVDMFRGLMLKGLDNDYAEPLFNRHQKIRGYRDWSTAEVVGSIYENPELLNG